MDTLLDKEKMLYENVASKTSDKDYIIAFQDYIGFLAEHGSGLLIHIGDQLIDRKTKLEKLDKQYVGFLKEVIDISNQVKVFIKEKGIEDSYITSEIHDVDSLVNGELKMLDGRNLGSIQSDICSVIQILIKLGYAEEANKFLITEVKSADDLRQKHLRTAALFKKYQTGKEIFDRQDASTLAGTLSRLVEGYKEIIYFTNTSTKFDATTEDFLLKLFEDRKNKEFAKLMSGEILSGDHFGRTRYQGDLERIHTSIVLNNDENDVKKVTKIFRLDKNDIYHYRAGKIDYAKRPNGHDPKYIILFKNILEGMKKDQIEIRINEFNKRLPAKEQFDGETYRTQLMKKTGSFMNLLHKQNIKNIHPENGKQILKITNTTIKFNNFVTEE